MKEIRKTSQFKKDYKRFDLIWFDKNNNAIELVRLGSHSELFGKGRKR
mgnify:CR=1 FL=1